MIVVQMQNDRVERQPLVATHRTAAAHVLEAVEEAIEARADRMRLVRIAGKRVGAFVGSSEGAGAALIGEVFTESLRRPPSGAFSDCVGELDLIGTRNLMHIASRAAA